MEGVDSERPLALRDRRPARDLRARARARPSRARGASVRARLLCVAALAALSVSVATARAEAEPVPGPWRKRAPDGVRRGDLVLRLGSGTWTRLFRRTSSHDPRFSHAGIVVTNAPNAWIVHAESDETTGANGVWCQAWEGFCEPALDCAVWRLSDDPGAAERIAQAAEARLGAPFDVAFDLSETNALYCTEFVRAAVNEAFGEERIGTSRRRGVEFVAVDDCYPAGGTLVFDARTNAAARTAR